MKDKDVIGNVNNVDHNVSLPVNSLEYWNNRFDSDWKKFDGNEQTKYFALLMKDLLPQWLVHEINENKYAICDIGCAEGDALPIYAQIFMTSEITGEDFSEKAIEKAKSNYSEFSFRISDIKKTEGESKYPIVISSNVVEHFKKTYDVLKLLCERSTKYTIIMIPYREEEGVISEHEKTFHTKDIPVKVDNNYLVYAKSVSCNSIYYPYEQILLIYAKDKKYYLLSELIEDVNSDRELNYEKKLKEADGMLENAKKQIAEYELQIADYDLQIADYELQKIEYEKQIKEYIEQNKLYGIQVEKCHKQNQKQMEDYQNLNQNYIKQLDEFNKFKGELSDLQKSVTSFTQDNILLKSLILQKNEYIVQAQEMCSYYATAKLMKLNHFVNRLVNQFIRGDKDSRARFRQWLKGKAKNTNRTLGDGEIYNPLMVIRKKMNEALSCQTPQISNTDNNEKSEALLSDDIKNIIGKDYTNFDVIILSVIDYDFRYQRPQHFASRFASNGHRVFYINANFVRPDAIILKQENLYIIDLLCNGCNTIYAMEGEEYQGWMDEKLGNLVFNMAISDAIVIVDYPNWIYGAELLRSKYGFKIITDYMDDYTGFLGTTEDFLQKNCIKLLNTSDLIVTSSQFLYDTVNRYTDNKKVVIVRNGTEVGHFYQASETTAYKERKIIGYYGAVSHWFAWEKVCYLAERFTDCDIVIVGAVTEYKDRMKKYSNIKLLGEKPYKELPKYLADFDVCLIPFDTSTDLIKATNPVKFYEYLSAGKKIIATEIPELMDFKDEYVYMSNDNNTFGDYVELCICGKDKLKDRDACIAFAKENDWQIRYNDFAKACRSCIPMISVVLLTYNNLMLNQKCINSILSKTAYANYELIIVDNQSTDGTIEYLKELENKRIPNVKVILNSSNLGFAGGNNVGIQASLGDYVLLLNNDTIVTRGWLTSMSKHLENNPIYGMCNPVTNSIGNESQIKVVYHSEEEMNQFAYFYTSNNMNLEYKEVDRLPLFATLIRKEVINKVGLLDDSYKIGMFEDDDYSEAVKNHGYKIVIAEDAFIYHENNASFKKLDNVEYNNIFNNNKLLFEKKWNKKWTIPKYRKGVTADSNADMQL